MAARIDAGDLVARWHGADVILDDGYACATDRLKIGWTDGDAVARIVSQVSTPTPDKP